MKVMLVEDEYLLNKAITNYLKIRGFEVTSFLDGLSGIESISPEFDIFILDIDLPHFSGIEILEKIHKNYPELPVIIISATIDMSIITKAYTQGCSDYLKKPFDVKELELKLNVFTRKHDFETQLDENLSYDKNKQQLRYNDNIIELTKKEHMFLSLLISKRGKIVSHTELESLIWGINSDKAYLRQLVNRLRKKLPTDIVENRVGEGYIVY